MTGPNEKEYRAQLMSIRIKHTAGKTPAEIARELGWRTSQVENILNSWGFQIHRSRASAPRLSLGPAQAEQARELYAAGVDLDSIADCLGEPIRQVWNAIKK